MLYFTADWHLFHRNIIKYCGRPFKNAAEMNKVILRNYQATVKEKDTVYMVGDLSMLSASGFTRLEEIISNLPGTKHLVLGNHDKLKPLQYLEMGFASVHTATKMIAGGEEIFIAHDPAWAQTPHTKWVCAHIHNHWVKQVTKQNIQLLNVGVDVHDFFPVPVHYVLEQLDIDPESEVLCL